MLCPCTEEGEVPLPVVLHDSQGPLLITLARSTCGNEIKIVNGRPVSE